MTQRTDSTRLLAAQEARPRQRRFGPRYPQALAIGVAVLALDGLTSCLAPSEGDIPSSYTGGVMPVGGTGGVGTGGDVGTGGVAGAGTAGAPGAGEGGSNG